jgi:hypothetical protein
MFPRQNVHTVVFWISQRVEMLKIPTCLNAEDGNSKFLQKSVIFNTPTRCDAQNIP